MDRVELHNTLHDRWTAMEPIRVGPVPTGGGTPGVYVTVERDGRPLTRIDVWPVSRGPFTQHLTWRRFVVLGWNDRVHLVDPFTRDARSVGCDGYFGHLHPIDDRLLIATTSNLICLDDRGNVAWTSGQLGVDGVVVDEVRDGEIVGHGEWDPPGGWKPFRLSLASGLAMPKDLRKLPDH